MSVSRPVTRLLTAPSVGPDVRGVPGAGPRTFPTLDRAFDAVENALARLAIPDPSALRSPRPVEEALREGAIPAGTLLVLDRDEFRTAEEDILDTVKDERGTSPDAPGSAFVRVPDRLELIDRRASLRELALVAPTYLFAPDGPLPPGLTRLHRVTVPASLADYRFVVADTPGFRVALVARMRPQGGFIGFWSGDESIVDEVTGVLRSEATRSGVLVPRAAPAVPPLEGITSVQDVWNQAAELRAHRVVREAELREIARAAALKGVQMRRDRDRRVAS
jgi:hypothetical protein